MQIEGFDQSFWTTMTVFDQRALLQHRIGSYDLRSGSPHRFGAKAKIKSPSIVCRRFFFGCNGVNNVSPDREPLPKSSSVHALLMIRTRDPSINGCLDRLFPQHIPQRSVYSIQDLGLSGGGRRVACPRKQGTFVAHCRRKEIAAQN
jgi:hypothetical protein